MPNLRYCKNYSDHVFNYRKSHLHAAYQILQKTWICHIFYCSKSCEHSIFSILQYIRWICQVFCCPKFQMLSGNSDIYISYRYPETPSVGNSTFLLVVVESGDGWPLPEEYSSSPIACMVARGQSGPFQSVPIAVKVCEVSEFGEFFKFLLQNSNQRQAAQTQQNASAVLMRNAGQLMWPDKYDNSRKTNQHQLHNDLIDFLQEKGLGWHKDNV